MTGTVIAPFIVRFLSQLHNQNPVRLRGTFQLKKQDLSKESRVNWQKKYYGKYTSVRTKKRDPEFSREWLPIDIVHHDASTLR